MPPKGPTSGAKRARFEQEALPHLDALYTAALRLARNSTDAQDLVQEAILRAYRFFHQFTSGTNCRAWLLTILYNVFRNGYRRRSHEQLAVTAEDFERRIESESLNSNSAPPNPESLVMNTLFDHEVMQALDGLPEEFRIVILMVDVEELSYEEVSQVLELPLGTVKSRVSRGRAAMRRELDEFASSRGFKKPMTGS